MAAFLMASWMAKSFDSGSVEMDAVAVSILHPPLFIKGSDLTATRFNDSTASKKSSLTFLSIFICVVCAPTKIPIITIGIEVNILFINIICLFPV